MTSYIIFKWSALTFGIAFGGIALIMLIGMMCFGAENGADKIRQKPIIKELMAVGAVILTAAIFIMIFSGLIHYIGSALSSLTWSPLTVSVGLICFGLSPVALLLIAAVSKSQSLMVSWAFLFFTVPAAFVGLIGTGIWALFN